MTQSSLGSNGLTLETAANITADLKTGFQSIYGTSINVDSNSPDGQRIGIYTQIAIDLLELIASVNSGFDPDQAVGAVLDQRVAINNITRIGGTYTVQPIDITVNATVTLQGLDTNYNSTTATGYTVQDSSGNQFILGATTTLTAGTTTLNFRGGVIGPVNVPINTITTPTTVVLGVTSVNNSSAPITVGAAQETDAQLRTRRAQSVANASTGYLNGLLGQILALPGVTEAVLYENVGSTTDANGTLPHTVWLVVAGGSNQAIASTLYNSKSYGAGMRGAVTYNINTPSGVPFVAQWDVPAPEPLYIAFTIKTTTPGFSFNQTAIKAYVVANLIYGIGQYSETSSITALLTAAIAAQGGGGVPVLVTISIDGITYTDYLATATLKSQFTVAAANISITVV